MLAETTLPLSQQLLIEAAKAITPAIALALLALLREPVRNFFFFHRTEYDLPFIKNQGKTTWTIQWEGYSIDIDTTDVHNDRMDDVEVTERNTSQKKTLGRVTPKDNFQELFNGLEFKLNTICRAIPVQGTQTYLLRFVLRRRG